MTATTTATATATVTAARVPTAVLTEQDILLAASEALREADRLRAALRDSDNRLRVLCRQYGQAAGVWGFAPHHLAQACRARGLI